MANDMVTFKTDNGDTVKLSPAIVRNYISNNPAITDAEIYGFLSLCKYQKLNPFLREVYIVKYGNNPATIVTGKETFTKRAQKHPNFNGYDAGIIVLKDGKMERRDGGLVLSGEQIVGGWAKVYSKATDHPVSVDVAFDEYVQRKQDGTPNKFWKEKPATMIRKVALVQALREAFPDYFGGLYSAEEMPVDMDKLPERAIDITDVQQDEPEYITDEQYHAVCKYFGADKEKQKIAVGVFNSLGIPQKHPKFDKAYRAISANLYDSVMDAFAVVFAPKPIVELEPVIEPEPEFEDGLPDSYEPEEKQDDGYYATEHVSEEHPNASFVPYGGKHKYAGQTLDEIPHWFLRKVIETPVAQDKYYDRNKDTQGKVIDYMNSVDNGVKPPFDLD